MSLTLELKPITTTQPLCPVFGQCVGCCYQDIPYAQELNIKQQLIKELLQKELSIDGNCFESIVPSPKPYYYRNRLDLKFVRTRDNRVLIGFTPPQNGIIPIETCSIADESIANFLPKLRPLLQDKAPERYRLANIVLRTGNDGRIQWGGIGKHSCRLEPKDYLWTEISGKRIFYSLETFFQANLSILPVFFNHLKTFDCWKDQPVLFDLYAGVGLFSFSLADQSRKIFLLEENGPSTTLAHYNLQYNKLNNVEIIPGRVEETLSSLLTQENNSLPKAAVIDPPRAGLTPKALDILTQTTLFNHLFYLSCNPQSLVKDLAEFIRKGWLIHKVIPFDFFPKTRHIETLVLLTPS